MKKTTIAAILATTLLTTASSAGAWTVTRDFEGVTPGAVLPYALGDNATQERMYPADPQHFGDNKIAHSGTKSVRQRHLGGVSDNSWRKSVGVAGLGPLTEGSQLWARVWLYIPADAKINWKPKIIRLYGSGSGADYVVSNQAGIPGGGQALTLHIQGSVAPIDYYADTKGVWKTNPNLYPNDSMKSMSLVPGQWNNLEFYVKVSSKATEGKLRVWLNGALIYDITRVTSGKYNLPVSLGTGGALLSVFDNWENPASEITQDTWVDDIIMTTDPSVASQKDAAGNPMIGDAPASSSREINPDEPNPEFVPVKPISGWGDQSGN